MTWGKCGRISLNIKPSNIRKAQIKARINEIQYMLCLNMPLNYDGGIGQALTHPKHGK